MCEGPSRFPLKPLLENNLEPENFGGLGFVERCLQRMNCRPALPKEARQLHPQSGLAHQYDNVLCPQHAVRMP